VIYERERAGIVWRYERHESVYGALARASVLWIRDGYDGAPRVSTRVINVECAKLFSREACEIR
jgi:hypothetical protein